MPVPRTGFSRARAIGVPRVEKVRAETWQAQQLTSATARLVIYRALIEDELDAPKQLARREHDSTTGSIADRIPA